VSSESTDRLVEIGVVGRSHNIGVEFRLFLYNDSSFHLERGKEIVVDKDGDLAVYTVEAIRKAAKFHILRLVMVTTREEAEKLKGAKICVKRSSFPEPESGEFYVCDLLGIAAWDGPNMLGRVSASREAGGIEVVTITSENEVVEVPLVDDFVEAIDLAGGRLSLRDTRALPRSKASRR